MKHNFVITLAMSNAIAIWNIQSNFKLVLCRTSFKNKIKKALHTFLTC